MAERRCGRRLRRSLLPVDRVAGFGAALGAPGTDAKARAVAACADRALGAALTMGEERGRQEAAYGAGAHDFDFLAGRWTVLHRRLKRRLARSDDWEAFSGTCESRAILAGQANLDENLLELPDGAYRAATLRAYDPCAGTWAIWWLDARHPHRLDPPVIGGFENGIGSFFSDDRFQGRPIRVRFIWSDITAASARWQQAFSEDRGLTWETNWVMEFARAGVDRRSRSATLP